MNSNENKEVTESQPPIPPPKKNIPIEGAKYVETIGNLKIYQYPEIKFTDIEESMDISLLDVG